jgi:hypothetical protein
MNIVDCSLLTDQHPPARPGVARISTSANFCYRSHPLERIEQDALA